MLSVMGVIPEIYIVVMVLVICCANSNAQENIAETIGNYNTIDYYPDSTIKAYII